MKKSAAIFGAGGHARVIASILKANHVPILGFFDDNFKEGEEIQDAPVLGRFQDILGFREQISSVYLAVGDNAEREQAYIFLQEGNFPMPGLIHPKANVEEDAFIGEGSVICLGSCVATEAWIGKGVIINTGASLDHESVLGDFVHVAPGTVLAGRVEVGAGTFIGMNASIGQKIRIGKKATIGAGVVVLKDVPDQETVVGVWN